VENSTRPIGPVPAALPEATNSSELQQHEEAEIPFTVNRRSPHQRKLARLLPDGWDALKRIEFNEKLAKEQQQ